MGFTRNVRRSQKGQSNNVRKRVPAKVKCTKGKLYNTHDDPEKLNINRKYARDVRDWLGRSARVMILDTGVGITSGNLIKEGIAPTNICAPNINPDECRKLKSRGINAPYSTIENCLQGGFTPNAIWYDSQTIISGNESLEHYPGVVAHRFLLQNKRDCMFAISLATRSAVTEALHGSTIETSVTQLERLFAMFGFSVYEVYVSKYKLNMVYASWKLRYVGDVHTLPVSTQPATIALPLLTWKNSQQLVGFPRGYVL